MRILNEILTNEKFFVKLFVPLCFSAYAKLLRLLSSIWVVPLSGALRRELHVLQARVVRRELQSIGEVGRTRTVTSREEEIAWQASDRVDLGEHGGLCRAHLQVSKDLVLLFEQLLHLVLLRIQLGHQVNVEVVA